MVNETGVDVESEADALARWQMLTDFRVEDIEEDDPPEGIWWSGPNCGGWKRRW